MLAAQIRVLQEKQEEIDEQIARKKITYAKISDTLGELLKCFSASSSLKKFN